MIPNNVELNIDRVELILIPNDVELNNDRVELILIPNDVAFALILKNALNCVLVKKLYPFKEGVVFSPFHHSNIFNYFIIYKAPKSANTSNQLKEEYSTL